MTFRLQCFPALAIRFGSLAAAAALAALTTACSSSATAPTTPLSQQRPSGVLRHGLELIAHRGTPAKSTRHSMDIYGCTPISTINPFSSYFYLTTKSWAPSDHFTVDGTGCNVALYVGPGQSGSHLDHATFNGTPVAGDEGGGIEILIEHASLSIDHTTMTPSTTVPTGILFTGASGTMDHTTISNMNLEGIVIAGSAVSMDHTSIDNSMASAGGDGVDTYAAGLSIAHTSVVSFPNYIPGPGEPADWGYNTGFLFVGTQKFSLSHDSAMDMGVGFSSFCSQPVITSISQFAGQQVGGNTIDFNVDNSNSTCAFTSFYTGGPF